MSEVTESVFDGSSVVIPMARVMFVEKNSLSGEICVVLQGAQHQFDPQGGIVSGYGRPDCPYLNGKEAKQFMRAWRHYRAEVEGLIQPE